jgi:hypothetical protein
VAAEVDGFVGVAAEVMVGSFKWVNAVYAPSCKGSRVQIIAFCGCAKVSVTGQAAAAKMRVLVDVYVNVNAPIK